MKAIFYMNGRGEALPDYSYIGRRPKAGVDGTVRYIWVVRLLIRVTQLRGTTTLVRLVRAVDGVDKSLKLKYSYRCVLWRGCAGGHVSTEARGLDEIK